MTHYERSLQRDLDNIRKGVLDLAARVDANLDAAIRSMLLHDRDLAYGTVLLDHPINRAVEEVDADCHRFVVRHLPSAGHLRFISSVLRMNVELERIGDYAETICREVASLSDPVDGAVRRSLESLSRTTQELYRGAIVAFREDSVERALATGELAASVEREVHLAYEELAAEGERGVGTTRDRFSKLVILSVLERVGDQAKNLCEEVVWARRGERKKRRPIRVLFVDKTNAVLAPLAVAAGKKSHPQGGSYFMAAPNPGDAVAPQVRSFLETRGHDVADLNPAALHGAGGYDVVVALEGSYQDFFARLPFQTVGLNWEIPVDGAQLSERDLTVESLEQIYRAVLNRVVELMDTVRGPES